ncbi:MAG: hypothetical protein FWD17_01810 [Polyangiaceae bacterium]|nr:hypothetical protein [Polyangiaceae bacterium]
MRTLAWVGFAFGGAAATVAAGTSGMLLYQKGVRDDNCDAHKVCSARGLAAVDTIHTIIPWNTASWIVTVAGLGAGVALFFASRDGAQTTAIALSPANAGATIGIRSSF